MAPWLAAAEAAPPEAPPAIEVAPEEVPADGVPAEPELPRAAEAEVAPGSVVTVAPPPPPPPAVAWVLDQLDLERSERLARAVARWTGAAVTPLGPRWCVAFADPPPAGLADRIARRQGSPVEERRDCDVAWFPPGSGYVAAIVEPPAVGVEEALGELRLAFQEVRRSSDPALPVRVCAPLAAVGEPWTLAEHLSENGLVVRAMYAVGGCAR